MVGDNLVLKFPSDYDGVEPVLEWKPLKDNEYG